MPLADNERTGPSALPKAEFGGRRSPESGPAKPSALSKAEFGERGSAESGSAKPSALSEAESPEWDRFWDTNAWHEPLQRFSQVTQLCVAVYDANGERRLGPYLEQPLAKMVHASGQWGPRGLATRLERRLARRAQEARCFKRVRISGTLVLAAMPVFREAEEVAGVITFGWVMGSFADPLACEHLARRFQLQSLVFWQTARQSAPVGASRLLTYARLLETLALSIAYQITSMSALQAASRARDTFLATVSHELRTPLTAMLLRAQGLKRAQRLTHERDQQALSVILQSAAVQQKLIDDLLDASRSITGKLTLDLVLCDVVACVQAAVDVVSTAAAAKGIALSVDMGVDMHSGTAVKKADPVRLQQLFWNLLGNAVKFTPQGGHIEVAMDKQGDGIVVSVRDSGPGIKPAFLPKVFERFAQAQSSVRGQERGLGLGLSISKHIAELHGGTLQASSAGAGQGATFVVSLP